MDDKDKKNFDNLIFQKKDNKKDDKKVPMTFDTILTNKNDKKPKQTLVTPNNPKIDINRARGKDYQVSSSIKDTLADKNKVDTVSSQKEMRQNYDLKKPKDVVLPTRSGFSVANPSKNSKGGKPEKIPMFGGINLTKPEKVEKDKKPEVVQRKKYQKDTPLAKPIKNERPNKVEVERPNILEKAKPIRIEEKKQEKEKAKAKQTIQFVKPSIKGESKPKVLNIKDKEEEKKVPIMGQAPEKETKKKGKAPVENKPNEPVVIKTTTSTLKKKPGTVIPEDESLEGGAKAGSKKYKADTRLDTRARSLRKYGREFEKWRKSQEAPIDDEYVEGDARVKEGRNSERVITVALILTVVMVLSLFLLFYCNVLSPKEELEDGRVRVSVEIEKDNFYDVDINGNMSEKIVYPGDYIDFDVKATNAFNIKGDNASVDIWEDIFVRFKMFLRIDGKDYETIKVNLSGKGEKEVPVIVPTINNAIFQTYDKETEDTYLDQITGKPIVGASDGYYYYNGILSYNETIELCYGMLLNGDAIIPDFANKRFSVVVQVQAITADYTSIRERTIWDQAPQNWILFMKEKYFKYLP